MMKVKQKISQGFRSQQGAEDCAIHRSLLSPAQKHGWNQLDMLAGDVQEIIKKIHRAWLGLPIWAVTMIEVKTCPDGCSAIVALSALLR